MAAKKKTASQNPSSRNNVGANPKGMNMKGQVVWNNPKPTAAFTAKGQQAKELASGAGKGVPKVTGKGDKKLLSGTGTPAGTSFAISQPTKPSNIAKAASAILPGGIAKTALNSYVMGKKVIHSSPAKGLKEIKPRTGSAALPKDKVNFSFNASKVKGETNIKSMVGESKTYVQQHAESGSIYVGRVPRSSIKKNVPLQAKSPKHVIADKPIKVKKEFDLEDPNLVSKLKKEIRGKERTPVKEKVAQQKLKKSLRSKPSENIA